MLTVLKIFVLLALAVVREIFEDCVPCYLLRRTFSSTNCVSCRRWAPCQPLIILTRKVLTSRYRRLLYLANDESNKAERLYQREVAGCKAVMQLRGKSRGS